MRAYPHYFRIDTGHRLEGRNSWHSHDPPESASCGTPFRRLVRSLWLQPSWLFAPWTDPTEPVRCLTGRLGLLHPGFQPPGRETAGYCYDATWGPASAGLAPASLTVSLAALPPQGLRGRIPLAQRYYEGLRLLCPSRRPSLLSPGDTLRCVDLFAPTPSTPKRGPGVRQPVPAAGRLTHGGLQRTPRFLRNPLSLCRVLRPRQDRHARPSNVVGAAPAMSTTRAPAT
jgi:hypothetical protein